ncbi:hypothetical protein [Martelella mangrovi]|uniref:Uncharacterized protein n=1 Tax=Martelella mangrovi TaxID=1397477 RepID=A0ABV2IDU6_9HYPH
MSTVLPINEVPRWAVYTASAGQTAFAIPFVFQSDLDISVGYEVDGLFQPIASGYTITGAGNPSGGTLTFDAGRTAGDRILVAGEALLERLSSIVKNGRFSSATIDSEFDRLTMIAQELSRDRDRAVKAEYGETGATFDKDVEDNHFLFLDNGVVKSGPNLDYLAGEKAAILAARDKAEQWAENPENAEVEPGQYSSKHHAIKAKASDTASAQNKQAAQEAEDKAQQWAENPENDPVEPGKYSAKHHSAKAEGFKDQASASLTASLAVQTATEQARDQVLAAVQFNAFAYSYPTLEAFNAASETWADDDTVLVLSDSSQFGVATGYIYDSGEAAFLGPVVLTGPGREAVKRGLQQATASRGLPRTMEKVIRKVGGEAVGPVKIAPLFDSINGSPHWIIMPMLQGMLRVKNPQQEKVGDYTGSPYPTTQFDENTPISGTRTQRTDYTLWYRTSSIYRHSDGEFRLYSGGAKPTMDEIHFYYLVDAAGGTFQVTVDGTPVGDVIDTSVGTPGEVARYTYTAPARLTNSNECRFLVTGDVDIVLKYYVNNDDEILYFSFLSRGGLDLNDAFEYAQARDNFRFVLNELAPDWVTWSARESERPEGYQDDPEDDPTPWVSTYAPMMVNIFKGLDNRPDVTVFSGFPLTSESSNNSVLRGMEVWRTLIAQAQAEGCVMDFVDEFGPFMPDGKEATARAYVQWLVDTFGAGVTDGLTGVHPGQYGVHIFGAPTRSYAELAFGILGGDYKVPWARQPGMLGLGTRFVRNDITGFDTGILLDGTANGLDAWLRFYRSFQVIDQNGVIRAQFGNDQSGYEDVLPFSETKMDAHDSGREIAYYRVGSTNTYLISEDDENDDYTTKMGRYMGALKLVPVNISAPPSGWLTGMAGGLAYGTDGTFRLIYGGNARHVGNQLPIASALGTSVLGQFAASDEEIRVADGAGGWVSLKKATNIAPLSGTPTNDDLKNAYNSLLATLKTAGLMKSS